MKNEDIYQDPEAFRTFARKKSVKRDLVDSIRTRYWYEMLQLKTGLNSAYAVERRFEPEAFVKKGFIRYHRNKWSAYRDGRRTPRASLVAKVDARLPGSARQINHVLWRALQTRKPVLPFVDSWIRELEPHIQGLVLEKRARDPGLGRGRRPVDQRLLNTLGRNPTLDSLACLTMLLREAAERGNAELAYKAVMPALQILVVHCTTAPMFNVADELFDLYRRDVFSLGKCKGVAHQLENYPFHEEVIYCISYLLQREDSSNEICGRNESFKVMLRSLQRRRFFSMLKSLQM